MARKTKPKKGAKQRTESVAGYAAVSAILLAVGIWIGSIVQNTQHTPMQEKAQALPVVFSPQTVAIAEQFKCSCGSCDEENLNACTCPTAISTKKFIESNLRSGSTMAYVVELVKNMYGHAIN
ncbi:MAG: hypothetical protein ACE5D8_00585 [Fidelibacterota bacterium]